MRDLVEFLDKWLRPTKPVTAGEDAVDSLALFAIIAILLYVMFK